MSISLIHGSIGTGKTYMVLEKIKENVKNQQKCILLVPEQQTFNTELTVQKEVGDEATKYLTVTNFTRLAEEVLHRLGNASLQQLDRGVTSVAMWKVLKTVEGLQYFDSYGKNADKKRDLNAGDVNKMLDTIVELSSIGWNADKLTESAKAIEGTNPDLAKKLKDLAVISSAFEGTKKTVSDKITEDYVGALAQVLEKENLFENTVFYMDSFVGFTEHQYDVIEKLHKNGNDIFVTVCSDEKKPSKAHLKGIAEMVERFKSLNGGSYPNFIKAEYKGNRSVPAQLAEVLWDFSESIGTKEDAEKAKDKITLVKAGCLYDECEAVARYLKSKHESGVPYKNMAIFLRNADTYRGILDRVLLDRKIPFFLSEKTNFSSHVLYRFILSTLSCILYGYKLSDVLTLVKTDMWGLNEEMVCAFESYCKTWHITGSRFKKVWKMSSDGFKEPAPNDKIRDNAENVRNTVIGAVVGFENALGNAKTCKEKCCALFEYMSKHKIEDKLKKLAEEKLSKNDKKHMAENARLAQEQIRFYNAVLTALVKLSEIFKDEEMDTKDFAKLFELYISSQSLASVPTVDNAVTIGSADLMRVEDVKVSVIMGLHEGEFPASVRSNTLFTQKEKDALKTTAQIPFVSSEVAMAQELFYLYRAVAKSNDCLLMTYALGSKGEKSEPSMAYNRVKALLSYVSDTEVDKDGKPLVIAYPEYIFMDKRDVDSEEKQSENAPWDTAELNLSASSVSTFTKCPFAYFVDKRLHLRDEKDGNADVSDDGTFMHALFQDFFGKHHEKGKYPLGKDLEEEVDKFAEDYLNSIMMPKEVEPNVQVLHTFQKQKTLYKKLLAEMVEDLNNGKFQPELFEQTIKDGGDYSYSVPFDGLNGTVGQAKLNGFVDRIDTYTAPDGTKYFRIIDYKSGGKHPYSEDKLASGEDIQLFAYAFPVKEAGTLGTFAGAEFLVVDKTDKSNVKFTKNGFYLNDDNTKDEFSDVSKYDRNKEPSFSQAKIDELQDMLNTTLRTKSEEIVGKDTNKSNTERKPSSDACSFCKLKNYCHKAEKGGF